MPSKFSEGDVVELKSGGPKMTVTFVIEPNGASQRYECQWFVKDTDLKHAEFGEDALQTYEPPSIAIA